MLFLLPAHWHNKSRKIVELKIKETIASCTTGNEVTSVHLSEKMLIQVSGVRWLTKEAPRIGCPMLGSDVQYLHRSHCSRTSRVKDAPDVLGYCPECEAHLAGGVAYHAAHGGTGSATVDYWVELALPLGFAHATRLWVLRSDWAPAPISSGEQRARGHPSCSPGFCSATPFSSRFALSSAFV